MLRGHGRSDRQLPIGTSPQRHARLLPDGGDGPSLLPFDGDHVIVPAVAGHAVEFFVGAPPPRP